jgi:hypothetical protein
MKLHSRREQPAKPAGTEVWNILDPRSQQPVRVQRGNEDVVHSAAIASAADIASCRACLMVADVTETKGLSSGSRIAAI